MGKNLAPGLFSDLVSQPSEVDDAVVGVLFVCTLKIRQAAFLEFRPGVENIGHVFQ
jgi:hypothetical protein